MNLRLKPMALVAIGSNLGNSIENVRAAMERLQAFSASPILKSSLWKTEPVDCPPGSPPFINAVVALEPLPDESPESLLAKLQALEGEFGRQQKKALNEPRPLDLDLLAFKTDVRNSSNLIVPHPRAHQRAFVLSPLAEIDADYVFPGHEQAVRAYLAAIKVTSEKCLRLVGQ